MKESKTTKTNLRSLSAMIKVVCIILVGVLSSFIIGEQKNVFGIFVLVVIGSGGVGLAQQTLP